jgi:hypothetical protein
VYQTISIGTINLYRRPQKAAGELRNESGEIMRTTSTNSSTRVRPRVPESRHLRGLADTGFVIDLKEIDPGELPVEMTSTAGQPHRDSRRLTSKK